MTPNLTNGGKYPSTLIEANGMINQARALADLLAESLEQVLDHDVQRCGVCRQKAQMALDLHKDAVRSAHEPPEIA